MLERELINYINNGILKRAKNLSYTVKDKAPSTELELFNESSLVIWSGESHNTIYQDETVNWGFRALHDKLHLDTGMDFTPQHEIELGRIQANQFDSQIIQDIVFCEVSLQANHYLKTGSFVSDQVKFTLDFLKGL